MIDAPCVCILRGALAWELGEVHDRGVSISPEECLRRWEPWTPHEVRDRLAHVKVPWGVVAGRAIDLFLGAVTREHDDIEVSVPSASFPSLADALAGFEWDVVGSGQLWPYPEALARFHQTWLRDPSSGRYHLDVFREPHDGDVWISRRDPSIRLPYVDVYERTADGIPYLVPELVLLFKAGDVRAKDQADFDAVVPVLTAERRTRLHGWLERLHPEHVWLAAL